MKNGWKRGLIILGVALGVVFLFPWLWGGLGWGGGMMGPGMMGPGMMGGWGFGPLFMILFWGLIIWGVVALIRGFVPSESTHPTGSNSAIEVLKKRYAQGEISKEEYEEKKRDLA